MHDRRSIETRTKVFVLLLLQLLLVGAAPYADARLDADAAQSEIHVEAESAPCAIGHDHFFCTLCRALGLVAASPVESGAHGARSPARAVAVIPSDRIRAGALAAAARASRGPPSA